VSFSARVRALFDGTFRFGGIAYRGVEFRMGPTAVVTHGPIHIVVMEQPVIQWDPQLYRCVGLEPAEAKIVAVKSPAAFRAAYGPIAVEIFVLDVPGVCSPNLLSFPWKRVSRPMFPFDEVGEELPMPNIAD
jgi:microcystin degradation protein MlrC